MRIALVAQHGSPLTPAVDPNADAQAAALTSLAQALAGLGHRVTIYARKDSAGLPDSAILARGVTVEHLTAGPAAPLTDSELTAQVRDFGDKLARRWIRNRPDIAHARSWTSGLAALAAARDLNVPVVQSFSTLGTTPRCGQPAGDEPDQRIRMETCIARSAAAVLAGTSAQASELIQLGVPRRSVTVVPDGVDTARFCPAGPVADRAERPRLLAVSPLAEGQGLDTLVRMLPGVPEAELVIAGGPPKTQLRRNPVYRNLRRLATCLGVQRRLVFTGHVRVADLPALLRSADLLVSATPHDPLGTMTVEAMACGTPAAVSAVGGNRDAVLDEVTGLLVPPGRPDLLARRIRRLLATPMRLEGFGIAAADRARARYPWDRIGRETAAAYERCLPAAAVVLAEIEAEPAVSSAGELAIRELAMA
ncbi:MAG TPA: glycosyltransferase [Streptosporangiaceae bacterium]|jgi:glycosyltransferase involved in cell wall biosynthesis